ncbi:hypothetical protein JW905_09195 [bacterium]|nr:hypothetical protein [candidate division CSSED10-310 bacterium]
MNTDADRLIKGIFLLLAFFFLAMALTLDFSKTTYEFFGDEAVYYCMTESLALDFDLQYERRDLVRVYEHWPRGPQGILLSASDRDFSRIHYAKPWLFPLLAAPFHNVVGLNGFLVLHAILLWLVCFAGYGHLRRMGGDPAPAFIFTVVFVFLSVAYIYVFQITPEFSSFAMIFLGLALAFSAGEEGWYRCLASAAVIGLNAAARPPNAVFILPVLAAALRLRRHGRPGPAGGGRMTWLPRLLGVAAAFLLLVILSLGITRLLTGQWLSHGGFRKRIVGHFPFEAPGIDFMSTGDAISTRTIKFVFHWSPLFHNVWYFFVGRFTGMLLYYLPAAAACWLFLRSRKDFRRWAVFLALLVSLVFHLVLIPTNYHGGSGAVGNRYFMHMYAAFFFLLPPLRRLRPVLVTGLLAALFTARLAINPLHVVYRYDEHAKSPPFTWFPLELSLINNWPTDDPGHSRISFGDDTGYMLYLVDDNTYGRELGGLWVRGGAGADMVVRAWEPAPVLTVTVRNGPRPNGVRVTVAGRRETMRLAPGEKRDMLFNPEPSFIYYNLAGDPSYLYKIRVHSEAGFVPMFEDSGKDTRYLGCHITVTLGRPGVAGALAEWAAGDSAGALARLDRIAAAGDEESQAAALTAARLRAEKGEPGVAVPPPDKVLAENSAIAFETYRAVGDETAARSLAERAMRIWPDRSSTYDMLLAVLSSQDKGGDALAVAKTERFTPVHACETVFGDMISLAGYEIIQGSPPVLRSWWSCRREIQENFSLFVHLVRGRFAWRYPRLAALLRRLRLIPAYRFQEDHQPLAGRLPTSRWLPGEMLIDEQVLRRPEHLPAGTYHLIVGLWNPAGDHRALPVTATDCMRSGRGVVLTSLAFP